MAEFAQIDPTNGVVTPSTEYPKTFMRNNVDNSAGFVDPYKISTGDTRGAQRIKGTIEVVDSNNVLRVIIGFKKGAF